MINRFDGKYAFLSNYYSCPVTFGGITYENSEAAFHAQKTLSEKERRKFANLSPSESKRLGRKVTLRNDWEDIKTEAMYKVCFAKFSQNENLKRKLLDTGNQFLEEGTTWHDNCWGNCVCEKCRNIPGENRLGKILMKIREELKNNI